MAHTNGDVTHARMTDGAGDTEPILSLDRRLTPNNESLYVNVTSEATGILDLEPGDHVDIHIYRDRLIITPREPEK